MEVIPDHPLLRSRPDQVKAIRELYNMSDLNKINEALDAVEEWAKKQEHLAEGFKYMTRGYLERLYLLARGSIEGTKVKVEKLFTTRIQMPDFCLNRVESMKEYDDLLRSVNFVIMPKLHPGDYSRVYVTQLQNDHLDEFSLLSYFRYAFMFADYRLHHEYSCHDRYVIDLKYINKISFIAKLNPILIKRAEVLCVAVYGTHIKGIHYLNAPPFVDKLISLLKQTLSPKVAGRIFVHNSYEDLHKQIPKEVLPKDFGGDDVDLDTLNDKWKNAFGSKEAKDIMERSEKMISDESKRKTSTLNEEYSGIPGSFRTLSVD